MAFGDKIKIRPDSILMKYIQSVKQTTESSADSGNNIITVTDSDGETNEINIKNGSKGSTGLQGDTGELGPTGPQGERGSVGPQGAVGAHAHNLKHSAGLEVSKGSGYWVPFEIANYNEWVTLSAGAHTHSVTTNASNTGMQGTGDSGNLQPYITCYMWKRTK